MTSSQYVSSLSKERDKCAFCMRNLRIFDISPRYLQVGIVFLPTLRTENASAKHSCTSIKKRAALPLFSGPLPDDMVVQVLILPNFAIIDYASQGKTRDLNVIDLNNCRTHFSYYIALSRGSSSSGSVIIQGNQWDRRPFASRIQGIRTIERDNLLEIS